MKTIDDRKMDVISEIRQTNPPSTVHAAEGV